MPSKYEIDSLDILSQLDVIVLHHVSQGYYHVTFLLVSELIDHLIREVDEWDVFAYLLVIGI